MAVERPTVLVIGDGDERDRYLSEADIDRLASFADWRFVPCAKGTVLTQDGEADSQGIWLQEAGRADAIVVYPGAPRIGADILTKSSRLKFVGELNGDRFAKRLDVEAAWERGICTVDTTNGSSETVAEWALGLILISMRNAGYYMRRILAGKTTKNRENQGYLRGDLTGKTVGLIGCGHAGRRLVKLLRPFETQIQVFDPYLPRDIAQILDLSLTSLDHVLSQSDVIVCLAPLTPATENMIDEAELDLIPSGTVLVNVSRGKVFNSEALVARLRRGDIVAGLDVFDPEPVPPDHEIIGFENVFLTPHIAGVTSASYLRFFKLMVDELERFFHGHETYFSLTQRSRADRRGEAWPHRAH